MSSFESSSVLCKQSIRHFYDFKNSQWNRETQASLQEEQDSLKGAEVDPTVNLDIGLMRQRLRIKAPLWGFLLKIRVWNSEFRCFLALNQFAQEVLVKACHIFQIIDNPGGLRDGLGRGLLHTDRLSETIQTLKDQEIAQVREELQNSQPGSLWCVALRGRVILLCFSCIQNFSLIWSLLLLRGCKLLGFKPMS